MKFDCNQGIKNVIVKEVNMLSFNWFEIHDIFMHVKELNTSLSLIADFIYYLLGCNPILSIHVEGKLCLLYLP